MKIINTKNKKKNYFNQLLGAGAGFTLIELIVSISLLVFMSTIILVDYRGTSKRSALSMEAHKFVGDIRRAQNMALGSREDAGGAIPLGGWGVYISDASTYAIFADDGDEIYDGGDSVYQTVNLSNAVTFLATNVGASLVFLSPDPKTYIDGLNSGDITITMQQSLDASNTKRVFVNYLGLVDLLD